MCVRVCICSNKLVLIFISFRRMNISDLDLGQTCNSGQHYLRKPVLNVIMAALKVYFPCGMVWWRNAFGSDSSRVFTGRKEGREGGRKEGRRER